jgi:transcriptional regulator with XRE-family HTH domain
MALVIWSFSKQLGSIVNSKPGYRLIGVTDTDIGIGDILAAQRCTMNQKEIAMRIKKLREDRGLGQKEVAVVLGISQSAYCDQENGHNAFTAVSLDKLAEYFGKTLDELLHEDKAVLNMNDNSSNGYNVVHSQTVNGVSEDLIKHVCTLLDANTAALREVLEAIKDLKRK